MLDRAEEIAAEMTDRIFAGVEFYGSNTQVSRDDVVASCASNTTFVFRSIRGEGEIDVGAARATGEARARAGAPLAAVMSAYRIGFRFMWRNTGQLAGPRPHRRRNPGPDAHVFVAQDIFTQAMSEAYREELTAQTLGERKSARRWWKRCCPDGSPTPAACGKSPALRMPTRDPTSWWRRSSPRSASWVCPRSGRNCARDIRSAWRLEPDFQVGIAHLGAPHRLSTLITVLRGASSARVGVSPVFDDLTGTGEALRYARLATTGRARGDSLVTVFA